MLETWANWLDLVNICVYFAHQTHEIYQLLSYSVDFNVPRELWNLPSKTSLSKCSFVWHKGLQTFDIAVKLKRNL